MLDENWRSSGARRIPRPKRVENCKVCGEVVGTNYLTCNRCFHAVEDIWLADWAALLEAEKVDPGSSDERLLAQVVMQETERHPWTVVDIAMTLLRCGTCGNELGSHYTDCGECGLAFGAALMSEFGVNGNEHALHVGRFVLRHPGQHSQNAVTAWRMSLPRILTGWLPSTKEAQETMARIKAGDALDVAELDRRINAGLSDR